MKTYDAAIVGGGIIGAACAASLSAEGLSVIVIEASGIGCGTTASGMGHLVVMDDSDAQFELTRYSQVLWNNLAPDMPIAAEYDNCGTIWVASDESEMAEVHRKNRYYTQRGIASQVLDEKALSEAEPNLREGLAGGLQVSGDSVLYQLFATQFLMDKAIASGGKILVGTPAAKISDQGVLLADGQFIAAGAVVNAAGTAAPGLTPELKIVKRKGHLLITDRYPNFARHQLVELGYLRSAHGAESSSVAFNVQPRSTGQVLVGSSRQLGVEGADVDRAILRRMITRAFEYMPALRKMSVIRVWTGCRPATPDNLPYIGKVPGYQRVYAAAGHEGLGITTSLGTAELIADAILGREPAIPAEPYSPARNLGDH